MKKKIEDERFSVRERRQDDWTLGIQYVNKKDEGVYVCQVLRYTQGAFIINLKELWTHTGYLECQVTVYS